MKKILFIAAFAAATLSASAQLVIGGELGIGGTVGMKTKVDGDLSMKNPNTFKFEIAPQVGYMLLDKKLEVGASLNLSYSDSTMFYVGTDHKAYRDYSDGRTFSISVDPYAKYNFFEKNGFALGVKGIVSLGGVIPMASKEYAVSQDDYRTKQVAKDDNKAAKDALKDEKQQIFAWGIIVEPVVTYMPTDHIRLELAIPAVGFYAGGSNQSWQGKMGTETIKYKTSYATAGLGLMNNTSAVKLGFAYVF